ncbi:uncharacterized protein LOC127852773 [Dreissena polymorpha]|uniref:Uncharacterized protein n=1 Tax=Dreissena polymorpha TaxID=45954 RepID=A0A9D4CLZ6_DREPO|nr:uncharacterized protein LOC127852773 [Dreissena polymorpha]KAH3727815.1 hypothetical protein DPMN_053760 [Dreissena polymorpha]
MWGRSECAGETVYRGFVVGPSGNIGGSRGGPGPVVCLPENPLGSHNVEPQILPPIHLQPPAHTESGVGTVKTPCAVCELYFVHDVIVIPGRNECFGEWRREYVGYMVSFYGDSGISESVCLHESQSPRISTTVNSTMIDAPLMMHIGVRGVTNYISTLPLICSVCSR